MSDVSSGLNDIAVKQFEGYVFNGRSKFRSPLSLLMLNPKLPGLTHSKVIQVDASKKTDDAMMIHDSQSLIPKSFSSYSSIYFVLSKSQYPTTIIQKCPPFPDPHTSTCHSEDSSSPAVLSDTSKRAVA